MRIITTGLSLLIICAVVGMSLEARPESVASRLAAAETQDTVFLGQRISLLEQRFNSLEATVRALEQQISTQRMTAPQPARVPDTAVLQSELEILRSLVRELQCAVYHLDERTLSAAAKEARKRNKVDSTHPCRQMPETPVQLSNVR